MRHARSVAGEDTSGCTESFAPPRLATRLDGLSTGPRPIPSPDGIARPPQSKTPTSSLHHLAVFARQSVDLGVYVCCFLNLMDSRVQRKLGCVQKVVFFLTFLSFGLRKNHGRSQRTPAHRPTVAFPVVNEGTPSLIHPRLQQTVRTARVARGRWETGSPASPTGGHRLAPPATGSVGFAPPNPPNAAKYGLRFGVFFEFFGG